MKQFLSNFALNNNNNKIKRPGGLGSWRTGRDYPNDSTAKNGQNPETSPGDLKRFAVTQTPVREHQLTLMRKTLKKKKKKKKKKNNNNNNQDKNKYTKGEKSCIVTAKVFDWCHKGSEFELQLRYHFSFGLIPQRMV